MQIKPIRSVMSAVLYSWKLSLLALTATPTYGFVCGYVLVTLYFVSFSFRVVPTTHKLFSSLFVQPSPFLTFVCLVHYYSNSLFFLCAQIQGFPCFSCFAAKFRLLNFPFRVPCLAHRDGAGLINPPLFRLGLLPQDVYPPTAGLATWRIYSINLEGSPDAM